MLFFDVNEITNENVITDLSETNSDFEILKEEIETIYEDIVLCENTFFFNEADSSTLKEKIHNIIDKIITWIKNMAKKIKFVAIEQRIKMLKTDEFEIEERVANIDLWLSYANDLLNHVAKDGQIPEKVLARYSIFTSKEAKTKKVNKSTLLRVVKSIQKSFTITSKLEKMESLMKQKVESGSTDLSVQVSNLTKVVTIYKNVIGASITAVNKALKGGSASKENIEKVEGQVVDKDGKPVNQHLLTYGESVILESEKEWSNIREALTKVKYEALLTENMELYNEGMSNIKEKIKDFFSGLIDKIKRFVNFLVTKFKEYKEKIKNKKFDFLEKVGLAYTVEIHDWNFSTFKKYPTMINRFIKETFMNKLKADDAETLINMAKESNGYARLLGLKGTMHQSQFERYVTELFHKQPEPVKKRFSAEELSKYLDQSMLLTTDLLYDLVHGSKKLVENLEKITTTFIIAADANKYNDKLLMARAAYYKQASMAAVYAYNLGMNMGMKFNTDQEKILNTVTKK